MHRQGLKGSHEGEPCDVKGKLMFLVDIHCQVLPFPPTLQCSFFHQHDWQLFISFTVKSHFFPTVKDQYPNVNFMVYIYFLFLYQFCLYYLCDLRQINIYVPQVPICKIVMVIIFAQQNFYDNQIRIIYCIMGNRDSKVPSVWRINIFTLDWFKAYYKIGICYLFTVFK